jgi:hypothetical protein
VMELERPETDLSSNVHPKSRKNVLTRMRDYCDFSTG